MNYCKQHFGKDCQNIWSCQSKEILQNNPFIKISLTFALIFNISVFRILTTELNIWVFVFESFYVHFM